MVAANDNYISNQNCFPKPADTNLDTLSAALQPLTGKLYTYLSAKRLFLVFVAIFEIGSLLCAVSTTSKFFILGRTVAGVGVSGLENGALTLIAGAVPMQKRPCKNANAGLPLVIAIPSNKKLTLSSSIEGIPASCLQVSKLGAIYKVRQANTSLSRPSWHSRRATYWRCIDTIRDMAMV